MRDLVGFLCVCALGVVPLVGCSDTQPECETGADCNDDNECTYDVCESASRTCSNMSAEDDTACDFDGFPGLCKASICEDAKLCEDVECDDDNECTYDVCDPATGTCDNIPLEDGRACSGGACLDGACTALTTVGRQCTSAAECPVEMQIQLECLTQFKGGYCGLEGCTGDADCPEGSACVNYDDGEDYCFRLCQDKPECNRDRSVENESNCIGSVTFVDSRNDRKACEPPWSGL